jgi:5'-nucleotidase
MEPVTLENRRPDGIGWHRITLVLLLLSALTLALLPPTSADAQSGDVPLTREQCMKGGWQDFTNPTFRNQGQCVSYVATNARHFTEIKLLAFNDFHGRLLPPSGSFGGAAYLATHLNTIRDAHPNALLVTAGDSVGATPVLSNLFRDEPTVDVFNAIGVDVESVGNHEFDRGQNDLLRRWHGGCFEDDCSYRGGVEFDGQDYVSLTTNVTVDATGESLTLPYQIIDVAGVDIGFIGVTTINTPNVVHPDGIVGLTFHPEVEAVNSTVPVVEAAGADVIVVLMHEGGRQDGDKNSCDNFRGATANITPHFDAAVDVVIEGHTHEAYVCDLEDGPLVTQAFEYGKMFTEIDLVFDSRQGGQVVARGARNHDVTRDVTPDPTVAEIIAFYDTLAGPALEEVVGTSMVHIPRTTRSAESAQGNLATDALIDQYGVDFAFQNSGGLRADLTFNGSTEPPEPPDVNEDGLWNIRRRHVLGVWPFGNIVALAEVDGPMLKAILDNGVLEVGGGRFIQVAGLRIDYYVEGTHGGFPQGHISAVEYWNHPDFEDGTPVDLSPGASYTIALNDFMAVGGDVYPVLGDRVFSLQDPLEVAVERYLMANSPVNPQVEGRIVEVSAP